jgi:hypothetical protein
MDLLAEYHLYLMGAVFTAFFCISEEYRQKIVVRFVIVLLALSIGYELYMGEPVTSLPVLVERSINQPLSDEGTVLRVNKKIIEQYTLDGMHIPDEMKDELEEYR